MSHFSNSHFTFYKENLWEIVCLALGILLIPISRFFSLPFLIILFFLLIRSHSVKFRLNFGFLLFLSAIVLFSYNGLITGLVTVHNICWFLAYSFLSYFIGVGLFNRIKADHDVLCLLFVIFLFVAFLDIPVTIYDIFVNGLINPERELAVIDSDEQRATTGRTIELSLAIAGIMMVFYDSKDASVHRTRRMFIILAVIAELCTLHFVSRTGIAIFVIAYMMGMLTKRGMSLRLVPPLLLLLVVAFVFADTSLAGLFASREQVGSSVYDAGGRTERWELGLAQLLMNPNGYDLDNWYAHNFWLDFGREGGLWAFVFLSLFSVFVLIVSVVLSFNKKIVEYVRKPLLVYAIIFVLAFFTEPVHTGSPASMYAYFMVSALTLEMNHYYKQLKRRK